MKSVRLALGILSGRLSFKDLSIDDRMDIGYNFPFTYTDEALVKERAEQVIINAFDELAYDIKMLNHRLDKIL